MSGDIIWCKQQMYRFDKRKECMENFCAIEFQITAVAFNAPLLSASTSGPESVELEGSFNIILIRMKPQELEGKNVL